MRISIQNTEKLSEGHPNLHRTRYKLQTAEEKDSVYS